MWAWVHVLTSFLFRSFLVNFGLPVDSETSKFTFALFQGPASVPLVFSKLKDLGTSLVVQWLRFHAYKAGGMDSTPDWETKIPHAAQPKSMF